MAQNDDNKIAVDFIDPLFAVVISISFTNIMDVRSVWFDPPAILLESKSAFEIGALLLGYSTVVLSWIGYHLSVKHEQIKINTNPGLFRFIFDIVLLTLYWLLLVKFQSFWFVLLMLVMIYFVFIIWDWLKSLEYPETGPNASNKRRRRGVTTFWFLVFFFGLFIPYSLTTGRNGSLDNIDWTFLALSLVATIMYRLHKQWLRPQCVLDVLAFHRPERGG